MNPRTTISATIDPLLKMEVQAILKRLGLSMSQAITLFFGSDEIWVMAEDCQSLKDWQS